MLQRFLALGLVFLVGLAGFVRAADDDDNEDAKGARRFSRS